MPSDQILGIRHGLRGFYAPGGGAVGGGGKPIELSREAVQGIHLRGGTLLGTSRGGADVSEIVRRLSLWGEESKGGAEWGGGLKEEVGGGSERGKVSREEAFFFLNKVF